MFTESFRLHEQLGAAKASDLFSSSPSFCSSVSYFSLMFSVPCILSCLHERKKNTMATVKSLYGTDVANGEPSQKVFVQKLCFARQQAASQSPGQDWLHPVMWKCNMFLSNTSKTKTYRMKIFHKAVLSISEHFTILTTGLQSLQ